CANRRPSPCSPSCAGREVRPFRCTRRSASAIALAFDAEDGSWHGESGTADGLLSQHRAIADARAIVPRTLTDRVGYSTISSHTSLFPPLSEPCRSAARSWCGIAAGTWPCRRRSHSG
ncbi:MAG: hypothetical protein AVDCRST_MAG88-456, partial [uncultured Thermomicrobiales bacterium]